MPPGPVGTGRNTLLTASPSLKPTLPTYDSASWCSWTLWPLDPCACACPCPCPFIPADGVAAPECVAGVPPAPSACTPKTGLRVPAAAAPGAAAAPAPRAKSGPSELARTAVAVARDVPGWLCELPRARPRPRPNEAMRPGFLVLAAAATAGAGAGGPVVVVVEAEDAAAERAATSMARSDDLLRCFFDDDEAEVVVERLERSGRRPDLSSETERVGRVEPPLPPPGEAGADAGVDPAAGVRARLAGREGDLSGAAEAGAPAAGDDERDVRAEREAPIELRRDGLGGGGAVPSAAAESTARFLGEEEVDRSTRTGSESPVVGVGGCEREGDELRESERCGSESVLVLSWSMV